MAGLRLASVLSAHSGGSVHGSHMIPYSLRAVLRRAQHCKPYSVFQSRYRTPIYSKRQIYLPFTIAASGGCERARKEISRFAARARRGVNVQNEIRFDVYDSSAREHSESRNLLYKTDISLVNAIVFN